jgi:predicted membrane channel-forming protein YqfA (hemolysin III family)
LIFSVLIFFTCAVSVTWHRVATDNVDSRWRQVSQCITSRGITVIC